MEIVNGEVQYERIEEIGLGQGMNSSVYKINDIQLGGILVAKEIPKVSLGGRFFHEAQAMFQSTHPNIVPIRCAIQTDTHVCLAMEWFERGSLHSRIAKGPIRAKEAIRIGIGVLNGAAAIHTNGFIHFDIKPSNVLFDNNDTPMIADFGQCERYGADGTSAVPRMYTHGLPPEYFTGIGTVHVDIYHIGLLLYRMVNGDSYFNSQRPLSFDEVRAKTLAGLFPSRQKFLPHVPKRLRTVIRRAIEVDAVDRYPDAASFASELGKVNVTIDWDTEIESVDSMNWKAKRTGRPELLVEMRRTGKVWTCQCYTQSEKIRKKSNQIPSFRSSSKNAAIDHLSKSFHALE